MKSKMKLAIVCVAGTVFAFGCGQSNSKNDGAQQNQSATTAEPSQVVTPEKSLPPKQNGAKDNTIRVKGLYIGMDIQTVPKILAEKFPTWGTNDVKEGHACFFVTIKGFGNPYGDVYLDCDYVYAHGWAAAGIITAGPDGKVREIRFSGTLVSEMFNADDMDATAFAKQFIGAYNIPDMAVADDRKSWTYTSPDGVKVTITNKKGLGLEKVASTQERKNAFD